MSFGSPEYSFNESDSFGQYTVVIDKEIVRNFTIQVVGGTSIGYYAVFIMGML